MAYHHERHRRHGTQATNCVPIGTAPIASYTRATPKWTDVSGPQVTAPPQAIDHKLSKLHHHMVTWFAWHSLSISKSIQAIASKRDPSRTKLIAEVCEELSVASGSASSGFYASISGLPITEVRGR